MKKRLKIDPSIVMKRLQILTNNLVNSQLVGNYRSVFKGSGLEFEGYRHYTPDDDAASIDWKASVRSKEMLVKELIDERNISVFFLIDVSSSMVYSSTDKLKVEYMAELVATLSYVVLNASDSVGFALFNDKIVVQNRPSTGMSQYHKLLRILADANYYGGDYDLIEALRFTMQFLKEYSIVIIISDFIGLKGDWQRHLKMMGKKFDLIGIMINDIRDILLPDYAGKVILQDVFSDKKIVVDVNSIRDAYIKYTEAQHHFVSSAFLDAKANFMQLTTDRPFIKPISDLFAKRAKRLR